MKRAQLRDSMSPLTEPSREPAAPSAGHSAGPCAAGRRVGTRRCPWHRLSRYNLGGRRMTKWPGGGPAAQTGRPPVAPNPPRAQMLSFPRALRLTCAQGAGGLSRFQPREARAVSPETCEKCHTVNTCAAHSAPLHGRLPEAPESGGVASSVTEMKIRPESPSRQSTRKVLGTLGLLLPTFSLVKRGNRVQDLP